MRLAIPFNCSFLKSINNNFSTTKDARRGTELLTPDNVLDLCKDAMFLGMSELQAPASSS